ncbi:hypothetical protein K431DRAFT_312481 [Polychaeton citri CBS 116435]|uniref:Zn(2)-C6 fungal-type domain-containing protein n=1 Tax=Polychaeton citri CBS 116435 TaxID=1314669 RepID=A0A9P4QBI6_9PEZI|nr:hypothetical protein K431DRAFT_312481 [Polychaeton citri CBS 116435]
MAMNKNEKGSTPPPGLYPRQKRVHKKSRNGCVNCKRRKVKCDERIPYCNTCSVRGIKCTYARSFTLIEKAMYSAILPSLSMKAIEDQASSAYFLPAHRVPDPHLWQHYLEHTSNTLTSGMDGSSGAKLWKSTVPAIAFSDPSVSHAVMALSALCLSSSNETAAGLQFDSDATADFHYYRALKHLQRSVQDLGQNNADEVLASTLVLIPCSLAWAQKRNVFGPKSEWLCHLRGFRTLAEVINDSARDEHQQSRLISLQTGPDVLRMLAIDGLFTGRKSSLLSSRVASLRSSITKSGKGAIEKLWMAIASSKYHHGPAQESYSATVSKLVSTMDQLLNHPASDDFQIIFDWAIQIPAKFVELMTSGDHLALAITAYWLVLTLLLDELWFTNDFGAFRLNKVFTILERDKSTFLVLLDWPREILLESQVSFEQVMPAKA